MYERILADFNAGVIIGITIGLLWKILKGRNPIKKR